MWQALRRIFSYTKASRAALFGMILFALSGTSLSLYVPILIGKAVDCAVGEGNVDFARLVRILIGLLAVILASAVLQWLMSRCMNRCAADTIRRMRVDLFTQIQHLPISGIDAKPRGDMIARMTTDLELISDGFLQAFPQFLTGIITIVGTLLLMLTLSIPITILVVILTPISLFTAAKITKSSHNSYRTAAQIRGELGAITEETVGAEDVIQSFTYEEAAEEKFNTCNDALEKSGRKATFLGSLTNPATRFVNAIIYAVVACCGALAAAEIVPWLGAITIGGLAGFVTFAGQYTKPFNEISSVIAELQNALASSRRIFEILDTPAEPDDTALPDMPRSTGEISLQHVSFSYSEGKPVLRDISLDVAPGQHIAIVGQTGCGKTTLMSLLLRFYETDRGNIFIDGNDIRNFTRDSVRRQFGEVLQESWIFTGTVAENIAYSRPDATREEIEAAAKFSMADAFIRRLPDGYDTLLTERTNLSAGEKQLLCLARIRLVDPPFLILDEATSNVDPETELKIQAAFDRLTIGKTCFVIAHRLETIRTADLILVMQEGTVVEQGQHETLLARNGVYADLFRKNWV